MSVPSADMKYAFFVILWNILVIFNIVYIEQYLWHTRYGGMKGYIYTSK